MREEVILKKHIISLWVKNRHGVLSRVSGTFNRRAYNIDSFSSGKINDDDIYRMTIILSGEDGTIEMIKKQLTKLQDVEKVIELDSESSSVRELVLVKLNWNSENKAEIAEIAKTFSAGSIKEEESLVTYEFMGTPEKVDAFLHILDQFEIVAANRSGAVAVE